MRASSVDFLYFPHQYHHFLYICSNLPNSRRDRKLKIQKKSKKEELHCWIFFSSNPLTPPGFERHSRFVLVEALAEASNRLEGFGSLSLPCCMSSSLPECRGGCNTASPRPSQRVRVIQKALLPQKGLFLNLNKISLVFGTQSILCTYQELLSSSVLSILLATTAALRLRCSLPLTRRRADIFNTSAEGFGYRSVPHSEGV